MSNLRLLHLVAALSGLRFGLGIWVLFYLRLTDYAGIGLAETVTIVTSFALEVPTGIAADRWGRKRCLVAAFALELAGYLLLAAAGGLGGLLASLAVLQLGKSLQSGTFEAMLWESLDERDRDREYVRVFGRINGAQLIAVAGGVSGRGFLYQIDHRLPFVCAGAAFGVAALVGLGLREPERVGSTATARTTSSGFLGDFKQASAALAGAWRLTLPLLLVGAFLAVTEEVLDDVLSVEFGFSPTGLGALLACAYVGAAAAAAVTHRLESAWGRRRVVFGLALVGAGDPGALAAARSGRRRTRRAAAPRVPRGARDRGHGAARRDRAARAARHLDLDVPGGAPPPLRRVRLERRHGDGPHDGARLRALVRPGDGGRDPGGVAALARRRAARPTARAATPAPSAGRPQPASGIQWPTHL